MSTVRTLTYAELADMRSRGEDLTIVDVRERHEFEQSNIDGSRCVPLTELGAWLGSVGFDEPLVFVCKVGQRSLQAATFAASVGYRNVSSLETGMKRIADE